MKMKLLALLLALAMLAGLAACAPAFIPEKSETARIWTDDLGRQVVIPQQITRIVPTGSLAQYILFAIAPDLFVGVTGRWDAGAEELIPREYLDMPYLGQLYSSADLNVEQLALADPQLIIDIGEAKKSSAEDLDALQTQTGIPSVFISATLSTMGEAYRTLGRLLGREERGEELAAFCERVYARTLSIMEKVGEHKVHTLYVLGEEGLNVIAAGSYHAEVLDLLTHNLAVVDNPVGKGTGNAVTMEQIALWDPEFVLFAPGSIYAAVQDLSPWNQISAIVSGNYVEVPDAPLNWMGMPPSIQRYLTLIWLPAVLYPQYCSYDAKAEILEFHRLFYGCTLTEGQYEAITAHAFPEG